MTLLPLRLYLGVERLERVAVPVRTLVSGRSPVARSRCAAARAGRTAQPFKATGAVCSSSASRVAGAMASDGEMCCPPEQLWQRIVSTYDRAQQSGACSSIGTNVEEVRDGGVDFILRVAVALRDKPKPPADRGSSSKKEKESWRNPFLPYEQDLWVGHISHTHTLLLNKFNLVAHHVLLVTRSFERQEDPLSLADMQALLPVMRSMPGGGLAYFNRGPLSGASQPHKHVQVVPLPLAQGLPLGPPFAGIIQGACASAGAAHLEAVPLRGVLPFRAYACTLPESCTADDLLSAYSNLMAACGVPPSASPATAAAAATTTTTPATDTGYTSATTTATSAGAVGCGGVDDEWSYNLVMTSRFMIVMPRRAEGIGCVSVNSMGLAGSFFVRSKEELEFVRSEGALHILAQVGQPWDEQ